MILIALGIISPPAFEYTPIENRAYTDEELTVTPDSKELVCDYVGITTGNRVNENPYPTKRLR